ncbi:glycosyltransferase family 15 protein [Mycena rebaudengoi]|nr:glycosyltransferase family 15 protein [Mycena rebaudengoi]
MTTTKIHYGVLVLAGLIGLHYLPSFTHEGHGLTALALIIPASFKQSFIPPEETISTEPLYQVQGPLSVPEPPQQPVLNTAGMRKANAVIVILARNGDLPGITRSMSEFEEKFNSKFGYPYVFLNEEPFSEIFKQSVGALTRNTIEFGLIPHEHWYQPDWIDEAKARAAREQMERDNVIYGGSVPYRNMLRFNAGFFHRHELLQKYRYYWRVEPDVRFFCTIDDDPFLLMHDQDKTYGFTLALPEYHRTIPGLWDAVKGFIRANPELVPPDNTLALLSDDGGETYNHCAFWSNFEIADLDFWRGEAYTKFFEYLDMKGGFYYERWADNTVHTIAVALFARKDQIHFFDNIGYRHEPFQHCPQGATHSAGKCECDMANNFDLSWYSCLPRYQPLFV